MAVSASKQVSAIMRTVQPTLARPICATMFELTGLDRIRPLGGLTRKHDAVCAVHHRVRDIADFCTGRAGVVLRKDRN